jgi:hypothetical protein
MIQCTKSPFPNATATGIFTTHWKNLKNAPINAIQTTAAIEVQMANLIGV